MSRLSLTTGSSKYRGSFGSLFSFIYGVMTMDIFSNTQIPLPGFECSNVADDDFVAARGRNESPLADLIVEMGFGGDEMEVECE